MSQVMNSQNLLLLAILVVTSCSTPPQQEVESKAPDYQGILTEVLTKEELAQLTPDKIIQILKEGNARFTSNNLTARDHSAQVRNSADGQYPKAIVLSCIDSRIPVEDVFDRGIGDLFVARVAGNVVNSDILGSIEYGCKVAGAKLILVLGHEHCGAVTAAIKGVEMGNITSMLQKIHPAIEELDTGSHVKGSADEVFVHNVCISNVRHSMAEILANSPVLRQMVDEGQIQIVGAVYDMDTGIVEFL